MWKLIVTDGETRDGPDYTWIDMQTRHSLDTLASAGVYVPPNLEKKILELQATIPMNKVAFYNRALGSYESFGNNRNGDCFDRIDLENRHDTFVKNAHYFMHHQNKDPALSRGRPVASAFNERTDMVDLIIVADMDKCADQIQALESGRKVPTSMGAKVAFDQCTICDQRSKRREDYCEHVTKLASPPYGMCSVLPDGRVCAVKNPNPNFFDLSDVIIGASNESETLLKVASMSMISGAELADMYNLSKIGLEVNAAISKRIPGVIDGSPIFRRGISNLSQNEDDIPDAVIDKMRDDSGFDGVLRNSAALGIVLKPDEFSRASKLGHFNPPTVNEIRASESMPKKVLTAALSSNSIGVLTPFYDSRSSHMPALYNRIDELREKTASAPENVADEDLRARNMYAAYRKAILDDGPVGGHDGEYWSIKCAGTSERMFTNRSRDYTAAAFLTQESEDILHKVLDRVTKIAQPHHITGVISETMAEELGVEALDRLAVESVSRF